MNARHESFAKCAFEHGTRSAYVRGCRCAPCKESNRTYYHQRQAQRAARLAELDASRSKAEALLGPAEPQIAPQIWTSPSGTAVRFYKQACPGVNGEPCPTSSHLRKDSKGGLCEGCGRRLTYAGLVDADRARAHLEALSRAGVGRRAVEAACDVSDTVLMLVKAGKRTRIRAETERRILSVDIQAKADAALVDAGPTQKMLRKLRRKYRWTKTAIAAALGSEAVVPALQLNSEKVLARSELAVKQLLARVEAAAAAKIEAEKKKREFFVHACPRCGQSHRDDAVAAAWCLANRDVPVDALERAS